jgi:hypothetical protein
MRRLAMLTTLGLALALAGCSISGECRKMGAPGSSAYQTCVSTILQRQNQLQDQRDRSDWRGKETG